MIQLAARPSYRRRLRGMTLIEILVAIVVLSIGLLGLAGLQLKGMQVNEGSGYRSQAAILVEDMADRLRSDRANALPPNSLYTLIASATPAGGTSPAVFAQQTEWLARLKALPGAGWSIGTPVDNGNGTYSITITVNWVDVRAQTGSGVAAANASATPGSFSMVVDL